MKPDQYEVSSKGRHRLTGAVQRGSQFAVSGLSTLFLVLFGLPFVSAGVFLILVASGVVHSDPRNIHAPLWVLHCAGAVFAGAGLFLWGLCAKQAIARSRRSRATRDRPQMAALQDYNWDLTGFQVSEWANAFKAFVLATAISIFLSMFNWWAFFQQGPWPVKILVGIFDLFALCLWYHLVVCIGRALKFGKSEVIYSRFPYPLSEPVSLRWKSSRGVESIQQGTFTLRCVEQWMEKSGSDSSTLVQEVLWSASWSISNPRIVPYGESVDLQYTLPAEALPTNLDSPKPLFWELDVNLKLPGLDFKARYLVPIYVVGKAASRAQLPQTGRV